MCVLFIVIRVPVVLHLEFGQSTQKEKKERSRPFLCCFMASAATTTEIYIRPKQPICTYTHSAHGKLYTKDLDDNQPTHTHTQTGKINLFDLKNAMQYGAVTILRIESGNSAHTPYKILFIKVNRILLHCTHHPPIHLPFCTQSVSVLLSHTHTHAQESRISFEP